MGQSGRAGTTHAVVVHIQWLDPQNQCSQTASFKPDDTTLSKTNTGVSSHALTPGHPATQTLSNSHCIGLGLFYSSLSACRKQQTPPHLTGAAKSVRRGGETCGEGAALQAYANASADTARADWPSERHNSTAVQTEHWGVQPCPHLGPPLQLKH